jgi:hypothetical protein
MVSKNFGKYLIRGVSGAGVRPTLTQLQVKPGDTLVEMGSQITVTADARIEGGEIIEPLRDRIVGRVSLENIRDPLTGETIVN